MITRIIGLLLAVVLAVITQIATGSAQPAAKVHRVGLVALGPEDQLSWPQWHVFISRLAELGYVEGKNVKFEPRWSGDTYHRVPEFLAELEGNGVDVIFAPGSKLARVLQSVVRKTPLVVYSCDAFDHVSTLARHGSNVTGVTCMTSELTAKRLEIFKEAVPAASRIMFFSEPEDSPSGLKRAQEAAPRLNISLPTVGFWSRADVPRALGVVAKERPDALFVYPDPIAFLEMERITEFALKQRLPSMYAFRNFVDAGGLMSYGANNNDMFRLAAEQCARILGGKAPSDVPMLQATRFELVVNLKTAKALGLTMPAPVLKRADHVIE
jgi:putative ABC transport system substrate-binding protein